MLESLIRAVLERDGKEGGESTVVALHCQQMREWGTRGGNIEHRPIQDPTGDRFKFLTKLRQHNQLKQRYDHIMDHLVCRGEVLWYFSPDLDNLGMYRIEFFSGGQNHPDPQFKIFYKPGGREMEKVVIRYSYDDESPGTYIKRQRWVTITITKDSVTQVESLNKPQFDCQSTSAGSYANYAPQGEPQFAWNQTTQRYDNPFKPYFPVVVSRNNARQLGQQGSDDFYAHQSLIETHEGLVIKAHKNLRMFANPILVTTRSAQEVMSQVGSAAGNTWASANRYYDLGNTPYSGSTHTADVPSWGMQRSPFGTSSINSTEGSLDTIFGNMGESERFAFIQADAVSGDQNLWIRQERELIHWILGGVDPLSGISSGATFGEVKTLFGRVQNTADKRSDALFGDTGLAKVYERIFWREEQLFKNWLFSTLVAAYPKAFAGLNSPEQLSDEVCQRIWELRKDGQIQIPDNPVGMLPSGDREVMWRYTREVFQNTTREELDRSIAARNEREDGLSQEWVLRKQYPNLTDQEIRNAMSGFSPRVVQNAAVGIQSTLQLFQQFMQIPDPENPKAPWAIRLGLPQLLEQSMKTLQREMAYGTPVYEPADEIQPLTLNDVLTQLNQVAGRRSQVAGMNVNSLLATSDLRLATSQLGGLQNEQLLPLLSGDIANSTSGPAAVLRSMGLPPSAADAIAGNFSGGSYQSPELRRSPATTGDRAGNTATAADPRSARAAISVFGSQLPATNGSPNWTTGTPLGRVGDIDPSLLTLYADQLRAIIAAATAGK